MILSTPRRRRIATPTAAAISLVAYLGMAKALDGVTVHSVRLERDGHYCAAAGVASLDGRGLALAVGRPDRRGCRIQVYGAGSGDAQAERSLDGLVEQWRKAGRPSLADCEITIAGVQPAASYFSSALLYALHSY